MSSAFDANVLGVFQSAKSAADLLEKLRNILDAPSQVGEVIAEVSAFREVLEIMHDASIKSDDQVISRQLLVDFKKFIRKAGPVMHELHQSLIPYSSKSRVHKLMMNMKDIRQEMVQSLTPPSSPALRSSGFITQISEQPNDKYSTSSGDAPQRTKPRKITAHAVEHKRSYSIGAGSFSRPIVLPPKRSKSFPLASTQDLTPCRPHCMCSCHRQSRCQSPPWLEHFLGQFFLGYSGTTPFWNRGMCNEALCNREQSTLLEINYSFPGWFLKRLVTIREYSSPFDGHVISFRAPIVISWLSEAPVHASRGNIARLQTLFSKGLASPFDVGDDGRSLLHAAVANKQVDTCRFLLGQHSDPNYDDSDLGTPVDMALLMGFFDKIPDAATKEIIRIFAPFNEIDYTKSWGFSTIHMIVLDLTTIDLKTFLSLSTAEIDSQDRFGRTALLWAAKRQDVEAVRLLLKHGARIDLAWNRGTNAFHEALSSLPCLQLLLDALERCSTYVPCRDMFTYNPTMKTGANSDPMNLPHAYLGNKNACQGIMNRQNKHGYSPLWMAVEFDKDPQAKLLIEHGADLNAGTELEKPQGTPLLLAIQLNRHRLIKTLIAAGARTDVKDIEQQGILHLAALCGDCTTMSILANAKIPNLRAEDRDQDGCTASELFENSRSFWCTDEDSDGRANAAESFLELLRSIEPQKALNGELDLEPAIQVKHGNSGLKLSMDHVNATTSLEVKKGKPRGTAGEQVVENIVGKPDCCDDAVQHTIHTMHSEGESRGADLPRTQTMFTNGFNEPTIRMMPTHGPAGLKEVIPQTTPTHGLSDRLEEPKPHTMPTHGLSKLTPDTMPTHGLNTLISETMPTHGVLSSSPEKVLIGVLSDPMRPEKFIMCHPSMTNPQTMPTHVLSKTSHQTMPTHGLMQSTPRTMPTLSESTPRTMPSHGLLESTPLTMPTHGLAESATQTMPTHGLVVSTPLTMPTHGLLESIWQTIL